MRWCSPAWQKGSGKLWVCPLSPLGDMGTAFFSPCASPQGSNQCMHVGLKSQIKSQAAASCREPTCHSSSHIVTASWHCSHSSHTLLQTCVPDTVCCHQRAPPAPFASTCVCHHALCTTLQSSAQRIIRKKGTAQVGANSSPPTQTWWGSWFGGTKKALPSPTSQVQGACTSCSTCGTAEGLFVLSSLQKSTVPSLLAQHQAWELGLSCILGPFAPHHRLLQYIPRGKCPDTGAGVTSSQARAELQISEASSG